jgi:hypothetical protein
MLSTSTTTIGPADGDPSRGISPPLTKPASAGPWTPLGPVVTGV